MLRAHCPSLSPQLVAPELSTVCWWHPCPRALGVLVGLVTTALPVRTETLSQACSRRSCLLAFLFSWHKGSIPGLWGPTQLGGSAAPVSLCPVGSRRRGVGGKGPLSCACRLRREGARGRGREGAGGASPAVGPFHPLGVVRAEEPLAKANFSPDNCHYY